MSSPIAPIPIGLESLKESGTVDPPPLNRWQLYQKLVSFREDDGWYQRTQWPTLWHNRPVLVVSEATLQAQVDSLDDFNIDTNKRSLYSSIDDKGLLNLLYQRLEFVLRRYLATLSSTSRLFLYLIHNNRPNHN